MLHGLGYNCRFAGAYVGVGHLNLYLKGTVLTKNGYFSFVDCTVRRHFIYWGQLLSSGAIQKSVQFDLGCSSRQLMVNIAKSILHI